jgi:hypothetical protein
VTPRTTTKPNVAATVHYIPPKARQKSGCRVRGPLPDADCTPGAVFAKLAVAQMCARGYTARVRHVTEATKARVYAMYGIRGSHHGIAYEVDHLISLELGGSNDVANLWPEGAKPKPGFHDKDVVENQLHAAVCSGRVALVAAQKIIATNWLKARSPASAR